MGAIGGLLGLSGGAAGTGFAAPAQANIGVNPDQLNTAYARSQNALQQQQALLNAIQGQNGLGLQTQAAQGKLSAIQDGMIVFRKDL